MVNPTRDSDRPDAPLDAVLDRAAELLTPTSNVEAGRSFRRPRLLLQTLLFKVLRPYWWQQRQVQELLVRALREIGRTTARADALEARVAAAELLAERSEARAEAAQKHATAANAQAAAAQVEAAAAKAQVAARTPSAPAARMQGGVQAPLARGSDEAAALRG